MIYFIQENERDGRIKIGKTNNIDSRFSQLKTSSPSKLKILLTMSDDNKEGYTETKLHEMFDESRLHGEWFELSDKMKWFISRTLFKQSNQELLKEANEANIIIISPRMWCENGEADVFLPNEGASLKGSYFVKWTELDKHGFLNSNPKIDFEEVVDDLCVALSYQYEVFRSYNVGSGRSIIEIR